MSDYATVNQFGVKGNSVLPEHPEWGVYRVVSEVDSDLPTKLQAGVVASDWDSVWLDLAFENVVVGTTSSVNTASIQIFFWSPAATVAVDPVTGKYVYTGGWVAQDVLDTIDVIAGDDGHKAVLLCIDRRPFYLKVTALGDLAVVHLLVSGNKRVG
jgi:hypothetical protein